MAELVGTLASGIGIATSAAQIGKNLAWLKTFWDEMREAPAEIAILVEEIETLHLILADIQDEHQQNSSTSIILGNTSTSKCLELCRNGTKALQDVVDELGTEVQASRRGVRQKWASAKFVSKKDKVEKHRLRLERAVRLLSLAYQIDLVRLQPSIIVAKLRSFENEERRSAQRTLPRTSTEVLNNDSTESANNEEPSKSPAIQLCKQMKRYSNQTAIRRYRLPVIITSSCWEFILAKSYGSWDLKIRTYNIRPQDSPVFTMVGEGDIQGLQDLFQRGLASPFDIDEYGWDILCESIANKHVETCKFLLGQGINVTKKAPERFLCRQFPMYLWILVVNMHVGKTTMSDFMELTNLLMETQEIGFTYDLLCYFSGSVEALLYLRSRIQSSEDIPILESSVKVAIRLAKKRYPDIVRAALSSQIVSAAVAQCNTEEGTLFDAVAYAIGSLVKWKYSVHPEYTQLSEEWTKLLWELINNGAYPSSLCPQSNPRQEQKSVLLELISGSLHMCRIEEWHPKITKKALNIWLEELERAGVDLVLYGQSETSWFSKSENMWRKMLKFWHTEEQLIIELWVYGFIYGPSPADWHVWMSNPWDAYLEDFWNMVEPPEIYVRIPGMWID